MSDKFTTYDRYKLWAETPGAANQKSDLIISSHGGRSIMGGRNLLNGFQKNKVPAGMTLNFYGPDRAVIVSGTIKYEFIDHNLAGQPHKVKTAGESYVDYELTKFQGEHGNEDETYDVVKQCLGRYDVVTIRYRPLLLGGGIYLSALLKNLIKNGYKYQRVHCSFCRCFDSIVAEMVHGREKHTTPT